MKILILLGLLISQAAFGDSSIECTMIGGSEQAMSLAPDKFEVNEAGSITLYVNGSEFLTMDINGEEPVYYGDKDINFHIASNKTLLGSKSKSTRGQENFLIKGCAHGETTTAIHRFTYKDGTKLTSPGDALYDCSCSLD